MIIKSLRMKGFRRYEQEYFIKFNEKINIIEGDNDIGKTTIGEAICWCFLGCNLFGNDKIFDDLLNNNSETAYCEVCFLDNDNKEHVLFRCRGEENYLILDGHKADVEMLSKFYYSKKVFLSVFNPYYFISLEPKEQRELLRSVLPVINYKDAFNMLSKEEQEILVEPRMDLNQFIKNAGKKLKELDKEELNFEGKIQYANSIINEPIEEELKFENEGLLAITEKEYDFILNSNIRNDEEEIKTYINDLNNKIRIQKEKKEECEKKIKEIEETIFSIKKDDTICPVCHNKILSALKIEEMQKEQMSKLNQIKKKEKECNVIIKTFEIQLSILNEKLNNNTDNKTKRLEELKSKILKLKFEKEEIEKRNFQIKTKIQAIEKAKIDVDNLKKAIEEIKNTRNILENQIEVAKSLIIRIIEKQMKMVDEYIDKVRIVFFRIDKETGELKDDYKIMYDNFSYNSSSSCSNRRKALIEISNLINKRVGLKAPIFIDDSELVTRYGEFDNQVIFIKVNKDKKELELVS